MQRHNFALSPLEEAYSSVLLGHIAGRQFLDKTLFLLAPHRLR